ncbi:hypothetical protein MXD58_026090, partial [Frankia sp. AgKG'84/4]|nr:hypothetical protein [Frankia sp. AgKG'84/4]
MNVDVDASPAPAPGGAAEGGTSPSAAATARGAVGSGGTKDSGLVGVGDKDLDKYLDLLPFKIPYDKQVNGIEDIDVNPLVLIYRCKGVEAYWELKNTSIKSFGFGWFDTSLGGGVLAIGPLQTVWIPSKALAVIVSPWDAVTKRMLVTVPTVGVAKCGEGIPVIPVGGVPTVGPVGGVPGGGVPGGGVPGGGVPGGGTPGGGVPGG